MIAFAASLESYRTVAQSRAKELPTRISLAVLGAIVLYLGAMPVFGAVYLLLCLVSQLVDHWFFRQFTSDDDSKLTLTRRDIILAHLSMIQAATIYSLISVGLWNSWDETGKVIALLYLCGAMFHIAVYSNQDMGLTISGGLPHAGYLVGLPLTGLLHPEGINLEYGLVLIAASLFLMHFFIAARRFGNSSWQIREAYLKAEAANAAKSRFLANMSHEIRTPLNGVMGMAQLLNQTELDDRQRDYVRSLNSSGAALRGLIDDVLDISRIEAGELILENTPFVPANLLRAAADTIAGQAASKQLRLELDIAPELERPVYGDMTRYLQILTNFAGNAVKFTDAGVIVISGRVLDSGEMEFSVSDTGPGIEPGDIKSIFERFNQLDDSLGRRHEGAGLGLTIAKEIAALAGGHLGVESELNAGSRFWVRLPRTEVEDAAAFSHSPTQQRPDSGSDLQPKATRTALVVEDNRTNRNLLTLFLEEAGWRVLQAESSADALALMDKTESDPDAVLLDLHMPGLSGEDLLVHLSSVYPDMPVVIVTADVTSGTAQRLRDKGAADCLPKPLNLAQLRMRLDQLTLWGRTRAV